MRSSMDRMLTGVIALAGAGALAGFAALPVQAQEAWSPPPASERCPSKWGAEDRRGSMNLMTPERAKAAADLIQSGEMVELGRTLEQNMPLSARGASTCTSSAPS